MIFFGGKHVHSRGGSSFGVSLPKPAKIGRLQVKGTLKERAATKSEHFKKVHRERRPVVFFIVGRFGRNCWFRNCQSSK